MWMRSSKLVFLDAEMRYAFHHGWRIRGHMSECAKEALFMRHVWCFILLARGIPCMKVFEDNYRAVQLAQNPMTNSNSKHIDVRHHHLRELVFNGDVVSHSCRVGIPAC